MPNDDILTVKELAEYLKIAKKRPTPFIETISCVAERKADIGRLRQLERYSC